MSDLFYFSLSEQTNTIGLDGTIKLIGYYLKLNNIQMNLN